MSRNGSSKPPTRAIWGVLAIAVLLAAAIALIPAGAGGAAKVGGSRDNMPFAGRVWPVAIPVACAPGAKTGKTTAAVTVKVIVGIGSGALGRPDGRSSVQVTAPGLGNFTLSGDVIAGRVWAKVIPAGRTVACRGSRRALFVPRPAPFVTRNADRRYNYVSCASGAERC